MRLLFSLVFLLLLSNLSAQADNQNSNVLDSILKGQSYRATIQQIVPAYDSTHKVPTLAEVQKGCGDAVLLIKVLAAEFDELVETQASNRVLLEQADAIDALAIYLLNNVALQSTKTQMLADLLLVYGQAQGLCKRLYLSSKDDKDLQKAFYFAEQYKSMLLKDALKEQEALSFGGVDEALRKTYQDLKLEIGELNKELLAEGRPSDKNQAKIDALSQSIDAKNQELQALNERMEKEFPQYATLQNSSVEVSTQMVQADLLDENTAFIEYALAKNHFYAYVITKDQVRWVELPSPDSINKVLAPFVAVMITAEEETLPDYLSKGYAVYQLLMEEILKGLPENIQRLVIVPDGKLHNLPFDVLPFEAGEGVEFFADVPYLLKKYTISYSYSAALLKANKAVKLKPAELLLGVAAYYGEEKDPKVNELRSGRTAQIRRALAPLPFAQQEVEKLKNIFDGNFLFEQEANEAQFKELAGNYTVIHLAMHGLANSDNPELSGLAFTENLDEKEDNILYLHEINNLKLNAELVVLSACETGIGSFRAGEGVVSVARSFMYAGAPSVIMTLWPVNDQATQLIMQDFYARLQAGKAKDLALREAKLAYIERVKDKGIAAHPVLWGPYIQLGDDQPISIRQKVEGTWLWFAVAGGAVLIFGIFFLINRLQRRKKD